ncbi:hypothetical protein IEQ34_001998 [Dendrobium chrysotoxum]|uniref:Trafficking protein particle complex subunit n=1 Tax=Dendrobium chrysotoxum TaxID=161865 RepID=A0AAV7HIE9_DENCH|nr:hypothetical protein IEQ34_001998 [Dendrobium chrysotoxum]
MASDSRPAVSILVGKVGHIHNDDEVWLGWRLWVGRDQQFGVDGSPGDGCRLCMGVGQGWTMSEQEGLGGEIELDKVGLVEASCMREGKWSGWLVLRRGECGARVGRASYCGRENKGQELTLIAAKGPGSKFFVVCEPGAQHMEGLLKVIYELYTDFVLKNPFYEMEMPIRCELFDIHLSQAIQKDRVVLLGR